MPTWKADVILANSDMQPESYDHITLTPEEQKEVIRLAGDKDPDEALRLARKARHYMLKKHQYGRNLLRDTPTRKITAEELYRRYSKFYDVDQWNETIVKNMCCYFSYDKRFKGSLQKGILLAGNVGTGKNTLMRFFQRNFVFPYRLVACDEIQGKYQSEGITSLRHYKQNHSLSGDPYGLTEIGFCFNDLGTEADAGNYGNVLNTMASIIVARYESGLPFCSTHITTNLTAEDITAGYGTRMADRCREMFNVIAFDKDAPTRRK